MTRRRRDLSRRAAAALCATALAGAGCSGGGTPESDVLGASSSRDATTTTTTTVATPSSTVAPAPTTTAPAPTTAAPPPPPAATAGTVAGTLEVPDGYERLRVTLRRDDGTEVGVVETTVSAPFSFEAVPPGGYELLAELTTGVVSDEGGDTSASTLTRTPPFRVAGGQTVRYACAETCEPA